MTKSLSDRLLADAGRVTWRYNHTNDPESVKQAIKTLRKTIKEIEETLEEGKT